MRKHEHAATGVTIARRSALTSVRLFVGLSLICAGCGDESSPALDSTPMLVDIDDNTPENTNNDTPEDVNTGWEDLADLAFEIDISGGNPISVQLSGGRSVVSYGGESQTVHELQDRVARGDLDGDGDDDAVAYIIETTGGTGVFHWLAPVFYNDGGPTPGPAALLGDRVGVERISVRDGLVEVSLRDRADDEPFISITQRKTLEIDFAEPEPRISVLSIEALNDSKNQMSDARR